MCFSVPIDRACEVPLLPSTVHRASTITTDVAAPAAFKLYLTGAHTIALSVSVFVFAHDLEVIQEASA